MVEDRLPESVEVMAAGLEEANGVYRRSSKYDDGSLRFSRRGTWRGDAATFTLYLGRPEDVSGNLFWYICANPDDDDAEEDLYACGLEDPETSGMLMPPVVGWFGPRTSGRAPYFCYRYNVEE